MSKKNAIEVISVSKKYKIHIEKNSTLKEKILYSKRKKYREYIALNNVNLNVPFGKTIGLIGRNGSGKSTLLKLISKIIYPDKGEIVVKGRVSSLLELGAGFHPEFSGFENIYMNASILGLRKKEVDKKLEEIIDFSGIANFINEPVRSYSSGMYMRLAFSVAVAVDPEILLVDEVLAVGDASFQAKCMKRMKQLKNEGKTIVIVTHDMGAIQELCDEVVWIKDSKVHLVGNAQECVSAYLEQENIVSL